MNTHHLPPPLGLEPRKFWLEARAGSLAAAIERYTAFPHKQECHFRLIEKWSAELRGLLTEIEQESV